MKDADKQELVRNLIYTVIGVLILAIANIAFRALLPDLADDYINIFSGVLLLILLGLVWLNIAKQPSKQQRTKIWSFAIVGLVTVTLVVAFGYLIGSAFFEKRTVYFVVDASEHMDGLLTDVSPRIKLTTLPIPEQVEIGLTVFGSSLSGKSGCDDITELVAPSPKQKSVPQVSQAVDLLAELKPSSYGSIQNAALFALTRLTNRRGVQQIFIITSGIDTRCGNLDRANLDTVAIQKNVEYELVIATVGNVSDSDKQILQTFTNGRFIAAGTAAELPKIIEQILNEPPSTYKSYNYGYSP